MSKVPLNTSLAWDRSLEEARHSMHLPGYPASHGASGCRANIARRIRILRRFAEKLYDIVSPGTTIVVTDAPALRPSPSAHAVLLMEAAKQ